MANKKIYLGADHGGYQLKEVIKKYLSTKNWQVFDMGATKHDSADDYPDFAYAVAKEVVAKKAPGILFCRNGIGVCIVANKVAGVRAVATVKPEIAQTAKADDNTNILCLGADFVSVAQAKKVIDAWLATSFSQSTRHLRRLNKIKKIEKK
jgi:ribose 5-phosphate isomerase B